MSENSQAGNRNAGQRQRARTLMTRIRRWEISDDEPRGGRGHRASRTRQLRVRGRSR